MIKTKDCLVGYHLTEDEGVDGVYVHQDVYDPTKGIGENIKHYKHEVVPEPPYEPKNRNKKDWIP